MFHFEKSITINKPAHEVFAFTSNPSHLAKWRYDVIETRYKGLPVHAGDSIEEVMDINGRKTCVVTVVDLIPDKKNVFKVTSGMAYLPVRVLTFEDEGDHTKFTIKVSALSDGFSRLIEPLSLNMYSIKWEVYLFALKKALEQN